MHPLLLIVVVIAVIAVIVSSFTEEKSVPVEATPVPEPVVEAPVELQTEETPPEEVTMPSNVRKMFGYGLLVLGGVIAGAVVYFKYFLVL